MRDYVLPSKANPVKILIVDDDANVRSILAQHLSHENCACITSENAFDALNKIKHTDFSLVISDVMMPGMAGTELLRFIKRQDSATSVIMITGVLDIGTAVDCLRLGACDYITKPFNLPVVRRAVDRASSNGSFLSRTSTINRSSRRRSASNLVSSTALSKK